MVFVVDVTKCLCLVLVSVAKNLLRSIDVIHQYASTIHKYNSWKLSEYTKLFWMSAGGTTCNGCLMPYKFSVRNLINVGCIRMMIAWEELRSGLGKLHQPQPGHEPAMDLTRGVVVRGASLFPNEATNAAAIGRPTSHCSSVK